MRNNEIKVYVSSTWEDYVLLDTGEGEKLERVGKYSFVRPYEDGIWKKTMNLKEWNEVDGKFFSSKDGAKSGWKMKTKIESKWVVSYNDIKFLASPTPFRHFGFFPEQAVHWDFIENLIKNSGRRIKFLNLFGYTGLASLFALRAGGDVTHVDASKQTLNWAKENQKLSGLDSFPMRIIEDDVLKFLEREIKRGNKYDAVIMDPPKFGRGPKGETWRIEKDLPKLLSTIKKVLSDKPLFIILTSYNTDSSALVLGYVLDEVMKNFTGKIEQGELCLKEKSSNRIVSLAHTAIWQSD